MEEKMRTFLVKVPGSQHTWHATDYHIVDGYLDLYGTDHGIGTYSPGSWSAIREEGHGLVSTPNEA